MGKNPWSPLCSNPPTWTTFCVSALTRWRRPGPSVPESTALREEMRVHQLSNNAMLFAFQRRSQQCHLYFLFERERSTQWTPKMLLQALIKNPSVPGNRPPTLLEKGLTGQDTDQIWRVVLQGDGMEVHPTGRSVPSHSRQPRDRAWVQLTTDGATLVFGDETLILDPNTDRKWDAQQLLPGPPSVRTPGLGCRGDRETRA